MRAMKDSGIPWIGEIGEDFKICRLKFLLSEPLKYGANETGIAYNEALPRYIRITDITSDGKLKEEGKLSLPVDSAKGYMLKENDILFARSGATVGKAFIFRDDYGASAFAGYLICARLNSNVNARYLFYYTQSSLYDEWKRQSFIQATIQNIGADRYSQLPIVLPGKKKQDAIVAMLDTECARIDAVMEQTRASIEEYKKLKQSIITEAVTKGIRPNRPMKDSGIDWIGQIPEDWRLLSLGAITKAMRNGYVGPTKDLFYDEGVRYIQSLHIKDGRIDFSRHEYFVSEEWANAHPKIKENDVLIVQTGDIGNVGLVTAEYDGCNCHALIIATPRTDLVYPEYLTYYLRSNVGKELLLYYKTGALLPHLNSGKIKFASICVPSIREQKEICDYLNRESTKIDALISKKEQLLSELESYKKSLIYEYVTGKKEVAL